MNPLAVLSILWTEIDPPDPLWMDYVYLAMVVGLMAVGIGIIILKVLGAF